MSRTLTVFTISLCAALGVVFPAHSEETKPDHSILDRLLREYVSEAGVDYRAWSENPEHRGALRGYLAAMEKAVPSRLERSDALAFWINVYNAATLNLVLDKYPVKSIKDVSGALSSPWKVKVATIEGNGLTLDQIENDVIRPSFLEPRVHFALNCAARSCPPLRAEAYSGETLDAQLEAQTVAFLSDGKSNFVDESGTLHLSKIFDWFKHDFEEAKGSVAEFVAPYIPSLAAAPGSKPPKIVHQDYDWSLNEAAKPQGAKP
jgi:hypothetical protein